MRRIAVCRMDVDNLGHAFISGFEQENEKDPVKRMHYVTLSRTSAFSRQMSLFFKCYINAIRQTAMRRTPSDCPASSSMLLLAA